MAELGTLTLNLGADISQLQRSFAQAQTEARQAASDMSAMFQRATLSVKVDDSALTSLNQHLSLKQKHLGEVNQFFNQNPITPKVDLAELRRLNDSVLGSELDKTKKQIQQFNREIKQTETSAKTISVAFDERFNRENLRNVARLADYHANRMRVRIPIGFRESFERANLTKVRELAKYHAERMGVKLPVSFSEIDPSRIDDVINQLSTKKLRIEVDHKPLTELNEHLDLKQRHLKEVQQFFNANPLKHSVNHKPLNELNATLSTGQQAFNQIVRFSRQNIIEPQVNLAKVQELNQALKQLENRQVSPKTDFSFSSNTQNLGKDIGKEISVELKSSLASLKGEKSFLENMFGVLTFPFKLALAPVTGVFNLLKSTISSVFTGFFEGIGHQLAAEFTKGFSKDIGEGLKNTASKMEEYFRPRVKKSLDLVDFVAEGLNIPGKGKGAAKLVKKNFETVFDNLIDPRFYRDLEDAYVKYEQELRHQSKTKKPQDIKKSEIFKESFAKVYGRFEETLEEDMARGLGALLKLIAQPLRINKRIQLAQSARVAQKNADILTQDIFSDPKNLEKAQAATSLSLVVGGIQPTKSRPGKPDVESTYGLTSIVQGTFPDTFAIPSTNPISNSLEKLESGPLNAARQMALKALRDFPEIFEKLLPEEELNRLINSLKDWHPLDRIFQVNLEGFDEDAITLASKALGLAQKFPDKLINLIGGSGGVSHVEEAIAILNQVARQNEKLKPVVARIKGEGVGLAMVGLTNTSNTNADLGEDVAKFRSFGGVLDHVIVGMLGEGVMANQAKKPGSAEKIQAVKRELPISMPTGALLPNDELFSLIDDGKWGYLHKIQEMIPSLAAVKNAVGRDFIAFLAGYTNLREQTASLGKEFTETRKLPDLSRESPHVTGDIIRQYLEDYQNFINSNIKGIHQGLPESSFAAPMSKKAEDLTQKSFEEYAKNIQLGIKSLLLNLVDLPSSKLPLVARQRLYFSTNEVVLKRLEGIGSEDIDPIAEKVRSSHLQELEFKPDLASPIAKEIESLTQKFFEAYVKEVQLGIKSLLLNLGNLRYSGLPLVARQLENIRSSDINAAIAETATRYLQNFITDGDFQGEVISRQVAEKYQIPGLSRFGGKSDFRAGVGQGLLGAAVGTLSDVATSAKTGDNQWYLPEYLSPEKSDQVKRLTPDQVDLPAGAGVLRFWFRTRENIMTAFHDEMNDAYNNFVKEIRKLGDPNQPYLAAYQQRFPNEKRLFRRIDWEDKWNREKYSQSAEFDDITGFNEYDPTVHPDAGKVLYNIGGIKDNFSAFQVKDAIASLPANTELDQQLKRVAEAFLALKHRENELYLDFAKRVIFLREQASSGNQQAGHELYNVLKHHPFSQLNEQTGLMGTGLAHFLGAENINPQLASEIPSNEADAFASMLRTFYEGVLTFEASGRTDVSGIDRAFEIGARLSNQTISNLSRSFLAGTNQTLLHPSIASRPFALNTLLGVQEQIPGFDISQAKYLGAGYTGEALLLENLGMVLKKPTSDYGAEKTGTKPEIEAMEALGGILSPKFRGKIGDNKLLMDFIPGKSAYDLLNNTDPETSNKVIQDLGKLMRRIHEAGFAHNDLSSANALMMPNNQLMAIDLANAQRLSQDPGKAASQRQKDINTAITRSNAGKSAQEIEAFTNLFLQGYNEFIGDIEQLKQGLSEGYELVRRQLGHKNQYSNSEKRLIAAIGKTQLEAPNLERTVARLSGEPDTGEYAFFTRNTAPHPEQPHLTVAQKHSNDLQGLITEFEKVVFIGLPADAQKVAKKYLDYLKQIHNVVSQAVTKGIPAPPELSANKNIIYSLSSPEAIKEASQTPQPQQPLTLPFVPQAQRQPVPVTLDIQATRVAEQSVSAVANQAQAFNAQRSRFNKSVRSSLKDVSLNIEADMEGAAERVREIYDNFSKVYKKFKGAFAKAQKSQKPEDFSRAAAYAQTYEQARQYASTEIESLLEDLRGKGVDMGMNPPLPIQRIRQLKGQLTKSSNNINNKASNPLFGDALQRMRQLRGGNEGGFATLGGLLMAGGAGMAASMLSNFTAVPAASIASVAQPLAFGAKLAAPVASASTGAMALLGANPLLAAALGVGGLGLAGAGLFAAKRKPVLAGLSGAIGGGLAVGGLAAPLIMSNPGLVAGLGAGAIGVAATGALVSKLKDSERVQQAIDAVTQSVQEVKNAVGSFFGGLRSRLVEAAAVLKSSASQVGQVLVQQAVEVKQAVQSSVNALENQVNARRQQILIRGVANSGIPETEAGETRIVTPDQVVTPDQQRIELDQLVNQQAEALKRELAEIQQRRAITRGLPPATEPRIAGFLPLPPTLDQQRIELDQLVNQQAEAIQREAAEFQGRRLSSRGLPAAPEPRIAGLLPPAQPTLEELRQQQADIQAQLDRTTQFINGTRAIASTRLPRLNPVRIAGLLPPAREDLTPQNNDFPASRTVIANPFVSPLPVLSNGSTVGQTVLGQVANQVSQHQAVKETRNAVNQMSEMLAKEMLEAASRRTGIPTQNTQPSVPRNITAEVEQLNNEIRQANAVLRKEKEIYNNRQNPAPPVPKPQLALPPATQAVPQAPIQLFGANGKPLSGVVKQNIELLGVNGKPINSVIDESIQLFGANGKLLNQAVNQSVELLKANGQPFNGLNAPTRQPQILLPNGQYTSPAVSPITPLQPNPANAQWLNQTFNKNRVQANPFVAPPPRLPNGQSVGQFIMGQLNEIDPWLAPPTPFKLHANPNQKRVYPILPDPWLAPPTPFQWYAPPLHANPNQTQAYPIPPDPWAATSPVANGLSLSSFLGNPSTNNVTQQPKQPTILSSAEVAGMNLRNFIKNLGDLPKFISQRVEPFTNDLAQGIKNTGKKYRQHIINTNPDYYDDGINILGKTLGHLKDNFGGLLMSLAGFYIIPAITQSLLGFGKASIDAAVRFESLNKSLRFAAGSPQKAAQGVDFVKGESDRLGLNFESTLAGYKSFAGATIGTPLQGKAGQQIFEAFTQAGAVMGLTPEQQSRVQLALQQMISKNVLSSEEIRLQLGEALPGTMSIFARGLGVSIQEFDKKLRSGGLTATDVLLPVSAQLKAETASSATNAGDSTGASFNRFNNSVKELQVNFGATLLPAIKIAMNGLADAIALVSDNGWNLVKAFTAIFTTGFKLLHIPLQRIFQELASAIISATGALVKFMPVLLRFLGNFALITVAFEAVSNLWNLSTRKAPGQEIAERSADSLKTMKAALVETREEAEKLSAIKPPGWFGTDWFNLDLIRKPLKNIFGDGFQTEEERLKSDAQVAAGDVIGNSLDAVGEVQKLVQNRGLFQELQNLSVEQSSISARKSTLTSLDRDELQKLAKREQEIVERQAELSIKTGAVQSGIQSAVDFSTQLYSDPRFIDQRPQIESTLKMALAAQRELNDFLRGNTDAINRLDVAFRSILERFRQGQEQLQLATLQNTANLYNFAQNQNLSPQQTQSLNATQNINQLQQQSDLLANAIAQITSNLSNPRSQEVLQSLEAGAGVSPFTLSNEKLKELSDQTQDQATKTTIEQVQQSKDLQRQFLQTQSDLARSRYDFAQSLKQFSLDVTAFIRNLTRGTQDLQKEVGRSIQNINNEIRQTKADIERINLKTQISKWRNDLTATYIEILKTLGVNTSDLATNLFQAISSIFSTYDSLNEGDAQSLSTDVSLRNRQVQLSQQADDTLSSRLRSLEDVLKELVELLKRDPSAVKQLGTVAPELANLLRNNPNPSSPSGTGQRLNAVLSSGPYINPILGGDAVITDRPGSPRRDKNGRRRSHAGYDYVQRGGRPFQVVSSTAGRITELNPDNEVGGIVGISSIDDKGNKITERYIHLDRDPLRRFKLGQEIPAGEYLSAVSTKFPKSSGPHLHKERYVNGRLETDQLPGLMRGAQILNRPVGIGTRSNALNSFLVAGEQLDSRYIVKDPQGRQIYSIEDFKKPHHNRSRKYRTGADGQRYTSRGQVRDFTLFDQKGKTDVPIPAFNDGIVTKVLTNPREGYGLAVELDNNGKRSIYAHLSRIDVKKGDQVYKGQTIIGVQGNTGSSGGTHLHYEGDPVDIDAAIKAFRSGNWDNSGVVAQQSPKNQITTPTTTQGLVQQLGEFFIPSLKPIPTPAPSQLQTPSKAASNAITVQGSFYKAGGGGINGGLLGHDNNRISPNEFSAATRLTRKRNQQGEGVPFGAKLRVVNPKTGKSVVVTVNDRGPFIGNRLIDLSPAAAKAIGFDRQGVGELQIEVAEVPTGIKPTEAFELGKGVRLPVASELFGQDATQASTLAPVPDSIKPVTVAPKLTPAPAPAALATTVPAPTQAKPTIIAVPKPAPATKPKPVLARPKPTARKPKKTRTKRGSTPPERTIPTFLNKFAPSAENQIKEIERLPNLALDWPNFWNLLKEPIEGLSFGENFGLSNLALDIPATTNNLPAKQFTSSETLPLVIQPPTTVLPTQTSNPLLELIPLIADLSQAIFGNLLASKKSEFGLAQLPDFAIGSSNGLRFDASMFPAPAVKPTPSTEPQDSYLSQLIPSFINLSQTIFGNLLASRKPEFGFAQLPDFAIGSSNGLKFEPGMFSAPTAKPQVPRQSAGTRRGQIEVDPSSPLIWLQPNMEVVTEFPNWNTNTPLPPKKPAVAPAQVTNTPLQTKKPVATTKPTSKNSNLQLSIQDIASRYNLQSLLVQNLATGEKAGFNTSAPPASAASTVKLIAAKLVADQVTAGELKLNQSVDINRNIVGQGDEAMLNRKYSIQELLTRMLRDSNNTAFNALITSLGGTKQATQLAQKAGFSNTRINNLLNRPNTKGKNQITVNDAVTAMSSLWKGKDQVSQISRSALRNSNNLFKYEGEVAGKIGNNSSVLGNIGVSNIDGQDYILGLYANINGNVTKNRKIIRDASQSVVDRIQASSGTVAASKQPAKQKPAIVQQSVGRIQSFAVPAAPTSPDFLGLEGLLNNPFITGETEFKPNVDLTKPVPVRPPSPVAPKPPSKPAQATPGIKLPPSVVPPPARATIAPPVAVTRIEPTQQLPILNNSQDSQAAISQAEELRKATYQLLPEIVRVTDQATAQLGVQRQANQAASTEDAKARLLQFVQGFVEYRQRKDEESVRFGDFSRQTSGQIQDLLLPTIKSDGLLQAQKLIPALKIGGLNFSPNILNDASREYNSISNNAGENILSLTRGIDNQIRDHEGFKNAWAAFKPQVVTDIAEARKNGEINLAKESEEFVKYIDGLITSNYEPFLADLRDKKANLPTDAKARLDTVTPNINNSLEEFANLNFDFLPKTQNDFSVKRERETATRFALNQASLMANIRTLQDIQTRLTPDDSQETIDNLANLIKTLQSASADLPQQAKNAIAFQNISAGLKESSQTDVLKADRIERDQGFLGMFKVNTLRYNSQLSDLNQRRLTEDMSDERYTEELRKIRYETDALRIALDPVREQFSTFFSDLISGSKSLGESFADMARSIIGNLTQMVSQALASQAFNALFGGLFKRANSPTPNLGGFGMGIPTQDSFASTSNETFSLLSNIALDSAGLGQYAGIADGFSGILNTVLPFATGGILPGGGFGAGIASSPTLALAGEGSFNEAIVPLPNGRSIPVELGGKIRNNISGTNNHNEVNISVNVSNNKADVVTSGQSNSLANQIRSAVIGVLIDEQRPGGALYAR
ncbi:MAG: serine hydrolase [Crinalium sp.]